ncbi:hypothetical protein N7510_008035 [Penicillium lagena]|uniref:uncharacterized protein n=1 Tax=Penicillium lagena TaxID=94218 RepID=UPI002540ABB6|nr:uncharacterized protein N7510_008035 [Penicillium lagena]KAJ5611316.1 hypothetical protein N7510_008035 [Penicillium lagena]
MRLFLSAGSVRRVRIVLLRATHLPFVALIWIYEKTRRHAHRRPTCQLPPMLAARDLGRRTSVIESSPSRCQDPLHPSVADTHCLGPGKAKTSLDQHAGVHEPGRAERAGQVEDMIDEVERLRAQVERVAATVGVQRRR